MTERYGITTSADELPLRHLWKNSDGFSMRPLNLSARNSADQPFFFASFAKSPQVIGGKLGLKSFTEVAFVDRAMAFISAALSFVSSSL
jgi:hypothetical protein